MECCNRQLCIYVWFSYYKKRQNNKIYIIFTADKFKLRAVSKGVTLKASCFKLLNRTRVIIFLLKYLRALYLYRQDFLCF